MIYEEARINEKYINPSTVNNENNQHKLVSNKENFIFDQLAQNQKSPLMIQTQPNFSVGINETSIFNGIPKQSR